MLRLPFGIAFDVPAGAAVITPDDIFFLAPTQLRDPGVPADTVGTEPIGAQATGRRLQSTGAGPQYLPSARDCYEALRDNATQPGTFRAAGLTANATRIRELALRAHRGGVYTICFSAGGVLNALAEPVVVSGPAALTPPRAPLYADVPYALEVTGYHLNAHDLVTVGPPAGPLPCPSSGIRWHAANATFARTRQYAAAGEGAYAWARVVSRSPGTQTVCYLHRKSPASDGVWQALGTLTVMPRPSPSPSPPGWGAPVGVWLQDNPVAGGVIIGCLAVLLVLCCAACVSWCWYRQRQSHRNSVRAAKPATPVSGQHSIVLADPFGLPLKPDAGGSAPAPASASSGTPSALSGGELRAPREPSAQPSAPSSDPTSSATASIEAPLCIGGPGPLAATAAQPCAGRWDLGDAAVGSEGAHAAAPERPLLLGPPLTSSPPALPAPNGPPAPAVSPGPSPASLWLEAEAAHAHVGPNARPPVHTPAPRQSAPGGHHAASTGPGPPPYGAPPSPFPDLNTPPYTPFAPAPPPFDPFRPHSPPYPPFRSQSPAYTAGPPPHPTAYAGLADAAPLPPHATPFGGVAQTPPYPPPPRPRAFTPSPPQPLPGAGLPHTPPFPWGMGVPDAAPLRPQGRPQSPPRSASPHPSSRASWRSSTASDRNAELQLATLAHSARGRPHPPPRPQARSPPPRPLSSTVPLSLAMGFDWPHTYHDPATDHDTNRHGASPTHTPLRPPARSSQASPCGAGALSPSRGSRRRVHSSSTASSVRRSCSPQALSSSSPRRLNHRRTRESPSRQSPSASRPPSVHRSPRRSSFETPWETVLQGWQTAAQEVLAPRERAESTPTVAMSRRTRPRRPSQPIASWLAANSEPGRRARAGHPDPGPRPVSRPRVGRGAQRGTALGDSSAPNPLEPPAPDPEAGNWQSVCGRSVNPLDYFSTGEP